MSGKYSVEIFTADRLSEITRRLDAAINGPEAGAKLRADAIDLMVKAGVSRDIAEATVPQPAGSESVEAVLSSLDVEEVAVLVRFGLGAAPSRLRQAQKSSESKTE